MPIHRSRSDKQDVTKQPRRDPYDVLGVSRNCTDQEIKTAYRKLALKYHPDKNANDPKAADIFKEVTFSYNILYDADKRRQYDNAGFSAVESESQELELDLSSLSTVNTMFAALFSKLGVPIKTTVSATVLEEALNGRVEICPIELGEPLVKKVEKQCAHFYSVRITEEEAKSGFVCSVKSLDKSKFKLLYFDLDENGGLSLALQEDSAKIGKVTSAGMYFLGFPVYKLDHAATSIAAAKDQDTSFFKKLDGFQPCEITELKAGTHIFAVYGDNFFKSMSYTIEALSAGSLSEVKESLRAVEAQILTKRVEVSNFETEYREVLQQFTEMTSRYAQEMQSIDLLLKNWNEIRSSYRCAPTMKKSSSKSKSRSSSTEAKDNAKEDVHSKEDVYSRERKSSTTRDRQKKKRWYNLRLKLERQKAR